MSDTDGLRPGEGFRAWTESTGDSVIVRAVGELDVASAPDFEEELRRALATDASAMVVDLARVTFMDSTGLRALLVATGASNMNSKRVDVRRELTTAVQRTLEVSGMAEKLRFVD